MAVRPTVLFVCVRNAGRSQMAAALLERDAAGAVEVLSAGSEPAENVHPNVVTAMREIGIDLSRAQPRRLDKKSVGAADVVVTMGCGDACPVAPGKRYLDWGVEDPAGANLATTRRIRGEIAERVHALLGELPATVER